MKSVFKKEDVEEIVARVTKLSPNSKAVWGKMNVAQMLAHCNVTYEFIYDNKHAQPNAFKKFLLKLFVKNIVVSEAPYRRSSQTSPEFIIKTDKDFETEKHRLINYVVKTQEFGEEYFDNKLSHSFGNLSKTEWNNMFYKHLNHHLTQFGV